MTSFAPTCTNIGAKLVLDKTEPQRQQHATKSLNNTKTNPTPLSYTLLVASAVPFSMPLVGPSFWFSLPMERVTKSGENSSI